MPDYLAGREATLRALEEELVGPCPRGTPIDCEADISFPDLESSYGPWKQAATGDEILQRDRPIKRYGVGVLYPPETAAEEDPGGEGDESTGDSGVPGEGAGDEDSGEVLAESAAKAIERIAERQRTPTEGEESDFDLSTANAYRPSAMALSFVCRVPPGSALVVDFTGGRYLQKTVLVHGGRPAEADGEQGEPQERSWWLRRAVRLEANFDADALLGGSDRLVVPAAVHGEDLAGLELSVTAYTRPRSDGSSLVTLAVVNNSPVDGPVDAASVFQSRFSARVEGATDGCILPYEEGGVRAADEEEESLVLLYRATRTFAVGHGCAADWSRAESEDTASEVRAECLPSYEAPSITPEILDEEGEPVRVPMAPLAGLVDGDDGLASIERLIDLYEAWIHIQTERVPALAEEFQATAARHIEHCQYVAGRMREGLAFLSSDASARQAFQLANHAMLLQQLRSRRREPRRTQYNGDTQRIEVVDPLEVPDWTEVSDRGAWRPFQIAFVLTALESTARKDSEDRDLVELIFFPTGGGKTEAYLCLAAFSMFYRRLLDPNDSGVDVLMRYTLRLLTAQQFQRAGSLVCAMEYLRRQHAAELGADRFTIGIWVGGSVTPNDRAEARRVRRKLEAGERGAENKFVVLRCPWCSAQMGEIEATGRADRNALRSAGYVERERTVVLCCPDQACEFANELPILVIDQDIYERRPSLVIGTVDKFAMLAWRPEARSLFGLDEGGARAVSPPNLIIQDELHLISGPLGSMLGLYETLVETLCTDRRGGVSKPKIVSSTATIRRSEQQISDLYARGRSVLFPPRGLDAGDSFFARYARDSNGELRRGRLYVGIHGGGLGSVQTAQVRSIASLVQAPMPLDPNERDPWWTLVVFFNSLRELGTSLSLLQSDIPDYLKVLRNRLGLAPERVRRLWNILELTGRLRNDEVPRAMDSLEIPTTGSRRAVDICLASNIVEVGVDIERLSLICVVGQPKTTSQYIQVTGRIGRKWWERPGLVATIYSPSKPRDRSHFEKFRSYHERLYAQVEPTSVTPFSPPVLERALHAVLIAYVRQHGDEAITPRPVPEELIDAAGALLDARVTAIDPAERETLEAVFARRCEQWRRWERIHWTAQTAEGDIPLMRASGAYASPTAARLSWAVPTSLRNVDAECRAEITTHYLLEDSDV